MLEITVIHWPFSDQFQYLADQNPFWSAKFTVHLQWTTMTYKVSYFQKNNQLLILISTTESGDLVRSRNAIMNGECSYGMVGGCTTTLTKNACSTHAPATPIKTYPCNL